MQITIISDCADANARSRQEIRYKALLGNTTNITFIGINNDLGAKGELEASGCFIDALDAYNDTEGIIVVNVAPRGAKERYPNGIPFCFGKIGKITVIGTPNCFTLAKKLGLISEISETDVYTVCVQFLPEAEAKRISLSQFRSFEYLPHLTNWIYQGKEINAKNGEVYDFGDENYVWYVDCFGNCKTTIVCEEGSEFTNHTTLPYEFIERLTDVPKDGKGYFTKGSSGYKDKRFVEIVVQRQPASKILNLEVGTKI